MKWNVGDVAMVTPTAKAGMNPRLAIWVSNLCRFSNCQARNEHEGEGHWHSSQGGCISPSAVAEPVLTTDPETGRLTVWALKRSA